MFGRLLKNLRKLKKYRLFSIKVSMREHHDRQNKQDAILEIQKILTKNKIVIDERDTAFLSTLNSGELSTFQILLGGPRDAKTTRWTFEGCLEYYRMPPEERIQGRERTVGRSTHLPINLHVTRYIRKRQEDDN